MKNKGIKIGVVFILLFALLSVAGCQQEDVVIVGVEPGQPGPTSGQLRISFAPVSSSASIKLSPNITINDLSLSADMSFTVTNTDTNATTVLTGVVIDADPAFTHAEFDANGSALSTTRVSLLIPYTLEPGNYKVTAVTGSINFLSHDKAGNDIAASHSLSSVSLANEGIKNTFTIAVPELNPDPGTDGNTDCRAHRNAHGGTDGHADSGTHRNAHGGTDSHADSGAHGNPNRRTDGHAHSGTNGDTYSGTNGDTYGGTNGDTYGSSHSRTDCRADRNPKPDEPPQNGR